MRRGGDGQAGTRAKWEKLPALVQQTAQQCVCAVAALTVPNGSPVYFAVCAMDSMQE